jgi:tetratricopeptide (TPR) repeat protein/DNA-binding HxlR family transcriptional regulator
MSRSKGIIYPPGDILNPIMGKTDYEYVILWMLTNNDVCEWKDFTAEISYSTLSGNLNKLMSKAYIEKPEKGKYIITSQGRDRFSELVYDRKLGKRRLKYPPKGITKYRNYDHWILWMLYNNYSCKWSDFKQEPLSINQSSLSNTLNTLIDDGFVARENKEYIITPLGKTEYLRVLKSYDLDRQSILEQESKRIEEITEKTQMFFKKYKIEDDELKYRYLDHILKFSYSKVESMLKNEEIFNKILLFLSINHPNQYPEYISPQEFSVKYKVDKTTLDYYIREIVDNEFFDIKFFKIEDEQGGIYYFQKNETIEKVLNAIVEKHIIKFTYLNKFHETTTFDVGLLIDKIIDDICTTLFNENLKPSLKLFLPEYIKYLAYKIETEKKLVDSEAKLEGFVWQNIFEEFQTFEPANIPIGGDEDEFHYVLGTDIFNVLNIMHLTKLYYVNSKDVQEIYPLNKLEIFKKISKALYKIKLSKAKELFTRNSTKLKTINQLIIKDLLITTERNFEGSIELTNEIIEKYPEEFIGYLLQSLTYFLIDNYEKSLEIIDKGIEKAYNVALISHKAQILLRRYEGERALQLIDESLSQNPGNFLLLKTKSIIYITYWMSLVKDYNEPLEIIDNLLKVDPNDKELLLLKSLYYCMVYKYKEAKHLITQEIDINTLKKSPRFDTEAYFILAFSYLARGKFEKALEIANLVLTLFPDHPLSFLTKALALGYNLIYRFTLKEPNIDTFLELIKLTVSFEPFSYDKTRYLLFQAHILNGLEKYDDAIKSIENAMEMVPTLKSLIVMKIYYLITSKREKKALKLIDEYLVSEPALERALLLHKSYIYVHLKDYEKGLEVVDKALEANPENSHIINNKAIILAYLGRREEAIETAEKLISLSPTIGNSYDTYGEVLVAFGEYENAIEKLKKALKLEPTGWFAFATCLKMGDCYKELGKYEKALEYYGKAKKIVEKMHPSERMDFIHKAENLISEVQVLLGESKNIE